MESQFRQPKQVINVEVNKQSIARNFGIGDNEVCYAKPGQPLTGYKAIYDKATQRAYYLPTGLTGTVVSMSIAGVLTHSAGTVDLGALAVTREEFVTLPGSFSSGSTINVKNERLEYQGGLYRWDGELPKEVIAGSTPASSGGIGVGAWLSVGGAGIIGGLSKPVTWNGYAGGADPSGLTSSLSAFLAASASGVTIHVPAGTYLVDGDADLSGAEWEFSRGAKINVTTGHTLTIGNVKAGLYQIFTGTGNVVFTAENDVVYPEWFLSGTDAQPSLTKCASACATNRVRMHISNNMRLATTWVINNRIPISCNPRASIDALTGAVNGIEIREGAVNWNCKIQLPNIAGFSGFGIKLRGCSLIDLEVGAIAQCGDGLVFECLAGTAPQCLDNNVRIQSIQGCTTALVATGDNTSNIFQGNETYVNFIVGCMKAVEYRSSVALTNFDSNSWEISAIDGAINGSVGLKNSTPSTVSKVSFHVKNWAGGFGSTGKFVDGAFNGSIIKMNFNGAPAYSAMNINGAANYLSYERNGWTAMPLAECVFNAATALADFNGGNPINSNKIRARLTVPSPIAPGASVVAFLCTPLDDGSSLLFSVTPTSPGGMVLNYVRRESKNVVRVNWTNYGTAAVAAGTFIDFTLNIG